MVLLSLSFLPTLDKTWYFGGVSPPLSEQPAGALTKSMGSRSERSAQPPWPKGERCRPAQTTRGQRERHCERSPLAQLARTEPEDMPAKAVAAGRETTPGSGHQRRQRPSTRSRSRTWPHRDDGALKEQNRSRRDPSRRTKRSVEREWYQPTRKRNRSLQCAFPLGRFPKKRRMEERHPRRPHREDHAVAPRSAYPSDGHRKPPRRLHLSVTRRGGEFLTDVADLILPQGEDAAQRDLGKRWNGAVLRAPPKATLPGC